MHRLFLLTHLLLVSPASVKLDVPKSPGCPQPHQRHPGAFRRAPASPGTILSGAKKLCPSLHSQSSVRWLKSTGEPGLRLIPTFSYPCKHTQRGWAMQCCSHKQLLSAFAPVVKGLHLGCEGLAQPQGNQSLSTTLPIHICTSVFIHCHFPGIYLTLWPLVELKEECSASSIAALLYAQLILLHFSHCNTEHSAVLMRVYFGVTSFKCLSKKKNQLRAQPHPCQADTAFSM